MESLNARQLKFVEAYLSQPAESRSAAKAYIAAGYKCSPRSAQVAGDRLLQNVAVQQLIVATKIPIEKAVERVVERVIEEQEITAERIVRELGRLAFFNPKNLYHPDGRLKQMQELDDATAVAISSWVAEERWEGTDDNAIKVVEKKIKTWDKRLSLIDLGKLKRFGLWGDAPPTTATNNLTVNLTILPDDALASLEQIATLACRLSTAESGADSSGAGTPKSITVRESSVGAGEPGSATPMGLVSASNLRPPASGS